MSRKNGEKSVRKQMGSFAADGYGFPFNPWFLNVAHSMPGFVAAWFLPHMRALKRAVHVSAFFLTRKEKLWNWENKME